jgi:hypothetical protein
MATQWRLSPVRYLVIRLRDRSETEAPAPAPDHDTGLMMTMKWTYGMGEIGTGS